MREHIETLVIAIREKFGREGGAVPRRKRPRVARETYVATRADFAAQRFAH